jgi:tripartite-type tricarboxylate transporter receptor subunit TctC
MMWRRRLSLALVTLLLISAFVQPALGKEYPTRPIELLCPYTPGGSFDLYSRLLSDRVAKHLGQPMVVINKPGGAGSMVAADIISSKPDGYKLAVLTNVYFYATVKTQKVPFDPGHIIPLANFEELKIGLQVKGDSPWKSLNDLLDYAKKNPEKLRWGHSGRGLTTYMSTMLIFKKVGAKTIDIPYKGAPEAITALLGGHIDAMSYPHGAVAGHTKAGTIRYLVFFSDRRYSDHPDIPCTKELGFLEATKLTTLLGVYVHKDTPEEVKRVLLDAFKKTSEDQEFKKGIENIGDEPRFGGPEFMIESIKEGVEIGVPILRELGLYVGK